MVGTLPTAAATSPAGSALQTSAFVRSLSSRTIFVSEIPLLTETTRGEAPKNWSVRERRRLSRQLLARSFPGAPCCCCRTPEPSDGSGVR